MRSILGYLNPGLARLRKIGAPAEEAPAPGSFQPRGDGQAPAVLHPGSAATPGTQLWLLSASAAVPELSPA